MIVLDTHAWIWWVADPARLSTAARKAIEKERVVEVADALANPTEAATLPLPRPERRSRRALLTALAASLALVGAGLGLAAAFTGGSSKPKFATHTFPVGSSVMPYPAPSRPPPKYGDPGTFSPHG